MSYLPFLRISQDALKYQNLLVFPIWLLNKIISLFIIIYFHMFVDINLIFNLETSSINVNRRKPIRVFLFLFK